MRELTWTASPVKGERWTNSQNKRWRIVERTNLNPPTYEGWPTIQPVVYFLFDMRKRPSEKLIGSFENLKAAVEKSREAKNPLPAHDTRESA